MHQRNAQATNRSWNEPEDTQSGLPLANDFKRKQQMEKQRNQEYNEFLKQVFSAQHVLVFFQLWYFNIVLFNDFFFFS